MGLVSKFALIALPTLVGCGMLSQIPSQASGRSSSTDVKKGVLPSTYKGPEISFERASQRANYLYGDQAFKDANFTPPWMKRMPASIKHWENGVMKTLKDGSVQLTPLQIEGAREAVGMFAVHDTRVNRDLLHNQLAGMPENQRAEFFVPKLNAVIHDAIRYAGIENPSDELVKYLWPLGASQWTGCYGKYDLQAGTVQNFSEKKWPTLGRMLVDPRSDCTGISILPRDLTRAAIQKYPELKGLEAVCAPVFSYIPGDGHASHSVFVTRIDGKYVFMFDSTYNLKSSFNTLAKPHLNGALDQASIGLLSATYVPWHRADIKKYQGFPPQFHNFAYVGGDRPGLILDLGNTNSDFLFTENTFKEKPREIYREMRAQRLTPVTEFQNWIKSGQSEQGRKSLYEAISRFN